MMNSRSNVVHADPANNRFVVEQDGDTAELLYEIEPGRIVVVHTEVPEALGGRGIGGKLVQAAVDQAKRDHLTVVPWCSFTRRWLERHPDALDGLSIDWTSNPHSG